MRPGHLERILRDVDGVDVMSALTDLAPTDLQSLLLEAYRRRSESIGAAQVLDRYRNDRFATPAAVDPRVMIDLDRAAFSAAASSSFTPIELSPVCPLATTSALGSVSQNNVVTTSRNSEVVSDSTNVLALECAVRRNGNETVRLCASHRLLRAQHYSGPASFAHFRVFSMCTAGRDTGDEHFEVQALVEQVSVYLRLLRELRESGYTILSVRVTMTDFRTAQSHPVSAILAELFLNFPEVKFEQDPLREQAKGYYHPFCFWIFVAGEDGDEMNIADGGFTDWTQKLLSNKKERLLISGMGAERLCYLFAAR
jgi:hypothetical protein